MSVNRIVRGLDSAAAYAAGDTSRGRVSNPETVSTGDLVLAARAEVDYIRTRYSSYSPNRLLVVTQALDRLEKLSGSVTDKPDLFIRGALDDMYQRGERPNLAEPVSHLPKVPEGHTMEVVPSFNPRKGVAE